VKDKKIILIVASTALILACLCLFCGLAFLFSSLPDTPAPQVDITATQPAPRDIPEYPLPGPDKSPVPLKDVPEGGLGNYELRADVWRTILTVTACDPLSPSDVYIEVMSQEELIEYWSLYCLYDEMEIYRVAYDPQDSGGVDFYITKMPIGYEE
jgi:hypothetical protein